MPLYAYLTPEVDFKRKFNHHQSLFYEWRLTCVYSMCRQYAAKGHGLTQLHALVQVSSRYSKYATLLKSAYVA